MHTNRLAREKSPYLLQHQRNPVDWYPWGPEAFEAARRDDKPIFLSVGYSTCHWCHVMERESFESEAVAEVLNRHFVPVKVDREERPDVDRVYMTFVQATTQSGGWPMSVWLTPDLKPFFGGTYFPPDNQYGRPGFRTLLEHLAEAWRSDRESILHSSEAVLAELSSYTGGRGAGGYLDESLLDTAFAHFRRSFDPALGGFGAAPKFPRPVALNFLFRYGHFRRNEEADAMALKTLQEMAAGGMCDQLGGGFHRYSVDERWFVPHFEKMLYDQAQLAVSYLEAHQLTRDPLYATVARDIFRYVSRDLTHPEGGFLSAEDADSVIDPAHPHEKGEGAFYIFAKSELVAQLGQPAADWFCHRYGVEEHGNVHQDPHGEFTGRNILYQAATVEDTARRFGVDADEVRRSLEASRATLLAHRDATHIRPHLDDKVLTAWNGLMVSAFAKGAQVLGDDDLLRAARRAADFVSTRMVDEHGGLLRRFRDGETAIPAFLDDYAFLAQGMLDLYEASFDVRDLRRALELTEQMRHRFEDAEHGGFFSAAPDSQDLVLHLKEDYDGAEPAGNSVAILNLLRLSALTGRGDLRESAERALTAFASVLLKSPVSVPQMAVAYLFSRAPLREVVLVGEPSSPGMAEMLDALRERFLPLSVTLRVDAASRPFLSGGLPMLADMREVGNRATAYVCQNYACQLPTADLQEFAAKL